MTVYPASASYARVCKRKAMTMGRSTLQGCGGDREGRAGGALRVQRRGSLRGVDARWEEVLIAD